MGFYERRVLPRLLDCVCGMKAVAEMRAKIVPLASGVVLEIGMGSGLNLPVYDPRRVRRVIGLDPAGPMLAMARARAAAVEFPVEFLELGGERIPLPDAAVDTVLSTYTLCTIPDPVAALGEMRRALKPGGRLLFCEHGLAPERGVARWQRRLDRPWGAIAGGCHLDRDMRAIIAAGGFAFERLETGYEPGTPRWMGHLFHGSALRDPCAGLSAANDDVAAGNARQAPESAPSVDAWSKLTCSDGIASDSVGT